jgi:L-alanine-DL-glutamate epimerase-like enolase superfamily enzyme
VKITGIETHVLLDPDYDPAANSSAQDDLVVLIRTDEGITGIGETDTNPWVAQAMIHAPGTHVLGRGLEQMLLGEDPLIVEGLWEKLYIGSFTTGRRGLGICAIGELDMALWGIRGQALGVPCWKLLGGAKKDPSLHARRFCPPDAQSTRMPDRLCASCSNHSALVSARRSLRFASRARTRTTASRRTTGHRGHRPRLSGSRRAGFRINGGRRLCLDEREGGPPRPESPQSFDLYFMETPLQLDDLDGSAFLAERSPIRIAAGELQNGRYEFLDLMDRGKVDVAQPDVGRVGGLTEARRVVDMAQDRGRLIVPHCWKTGIGIAATAHLAATAPHCPYIEFLPPSLAESALRRELEQSELEMINGQIPLPQNPGLGVELKGGALEKFRAEAKLVCRT